MSHMSEIIIQIEDLYASGISSKAISEYLNIPKHLVDDVIRIYCEEID